MNYILLFYFLAGSRQHSEDEEEEEEEDCDYSPEEDDWKKVYIIFYAVYSFAQYFKFILALSKHSYPR